MLCTDSKGKHIGSEPIMHVEHDKYNCVAFCASQIYTYTVFFLHKHFGSERVLHRPAREVPNTRVFSPVRVTCIAKVSH